MKLKIESLPSIQLVFQRQILHKAQKKVVPEMCHNLEYGSFQVEEEEDEQLLEDRNKISKSKLLYLSIIIFIFFI